LSELVTRRVDERVVDRVPVILVN